MTFKIDTQFAILDSMNDALAELLRCPLDPTRSSPLVREEQELVCNCGTRFPVKLGLPILLADQADLPAGCMMIHKLPCRKRSR